MLLTALLSFVAGLLTTLAPCVLPLLPIILGGSVTTGSSKKRPYIITASLVVSLILFTILLKASTVLIDVNPRVWPIVSGLLVTVLGVFMLFPTLWVLIIAKLGIEHKTQGALSKAFQNKNHTVSAILTGAALGPVFSSCSPTYAWVIATVLPSNTYSGIFYLAIYCLGVATSLLAVALLGRRLLTKIKWASDPKGWFQKVLAVLFILVGVFVMTGWDKKVQTYFVEKDILNLIELEQKLVPENDQTTPNSQPSTNGKTQYNVSPYAAPDLQNIADWVNSPSLSLNDLKGKVVLIDFWTYSCINCIRTQPYLNAWYESYEKDGLVIIGVHAPEFAFEKVPANVKKAVADANIKYPVALDNNFSTWNAYKNRFWPAKYLIDKDGDVRYTHFGEGDYEKTEQTIQALLQETGKTVTQNITKDTTLTKPVLGQTPETYLGFERGERFANTDQFIANTAVSYTLKTTLGSNEWSLGGKWTVANESSTSAEKGSQLGLSFSAREAYLVMSGPIGSNVEVSIATPNQQGTNTITAKTITIDGARLYTIFSSDSFVKNKNLTLTFSEGVTINALTFGS